MRLLEYNDDGFKLTTFRDIPDYAILSHTWGPDSEEVTFRDIVDGTGEDKTGFKKIRFCAAQARRDGLRYFWVDTCCIDKSNNTELSTAINSMFRWYQNATRCYVYLSDIDEPAWEQAFEASKWFTRGWTLQELLAPASVEFFTKEDRRLGDKRSLEQQIHNITGIAVAALRGGDLAQFDVEERFKWAKTRQTTHEEDWAYCLLGIFGIFMPLIYGEGRANAVRRLEREIAEAEIRSDTSTHHGARSRTWMVPFERNLSFTGRDFELKRLRDALFTGHHTTKVAITGLGGVGKTQLALELVYRMSVEHKNCSILWIPATSNESLGQAYLHAARELGIPGWEDDKADVKRLVQHHLSSESAGQWLLVFDNADDVGIWVDKSAPTSDRLIDYLPKSHWGSIIFTTRDKKTAVKLASRNVVEVSEMDEVGGRQLLQNYLVDQDVLNQGDTTALLARLTYLPLAIVQATVYINENGVGLRDYMSLLEEQEEDVIDLLSQDFDDEGRYRDVKNPVATTWLISFDQVRQRDPLAADYLSFMACVDAKNIPQALLPSGLSQKKEIEAMGTLQGYSFIAKRTTGAAINIHRLVHLATRNWLRKEGLLAAWTTRVIARLAEMLADADHANRVIWRSFMPHAHYALGLGLGGEDKDRLDLLWRYGICLLHDGRYNEAEMPFQRVMETRKRVLGEEHPDTLTSMGNLASTYRNQGRWKEAESLEVQVMETFKRVLGEEHPDTLTSMGNLASTCWNQGRWKEAESLEVQVMETFKRVLGEEHPDTLTSMANLASTYRNQGRWKEAESLEVQVMETFKRVLGEEHPDTLASMGNLASTCWKQGRWKEAESLEVQVMETRKRVLGEEHPDTLTSMGNLASTYRNQGRWKEAESLSVQVMETRKRVLGEEHPDTLTSMNNLAFAWKEQGRQAEALDLIKDCTQAQQRVLGPEHPYTVSTLAVVKRWSS